MTRLIPCTLVLLMGCPAFAGGGQGAVTVARYCTNFAEVYARTNAFVLQDGSVRTERTSGIFLWISNFFQPPDSRFTAGYECRFRAGNGEARKFSVLILLTGTLAFARHTQWERLQLIPIAFLTDGDRAGYGVFKYLEIL